MPFLLQLNPPLLVQFPLLLGIEFCLHLLRLSLLLPNMVLPFLLLNSILVDDLLDLLSFLDRSLVDFTALALPAAFKLTFLLFDFSLSLLEVLSLLSQLSFSLKSGLFDLPVSQLSLLLGLFLHLDLLLVHELSSFLVSLLKILFPQIDSSLLLR